MKNDVIVIRKIPLLPFLEALEEIYNHGVDYIDLVGTLNSIQDELAIMVKEDYYAPQELDELSEDELNQLI